MLKEPFPLSTSARERSAGRAVPPSQLVLLLELQPWQEGSGGNNVWVLHCCTQSEARTRARPAQLWQLQLKCWIQPRTGRVWQGGSHIQQNRISHFPPPILSLFLCLHGAVPLQGASCSLEREKPLWPPYGIPQTPISLHLLLGLMNPEERCLERETGRQGSCSPPEQCLHPEKSTAVTEALCFLSLQHTCSHCSLSSRSLGT